MIIEPGQQTYYELLEISQNAPQHEIDEAYRRAKSTYSPDSPALYSMFTPDEARSLLKLIEEAYLTLSNYNRRAEYDRTLDGPGAPLDLHAADNLPDFVLPAEEEDFKADSPVADPGQIDSSPKVTETIPDGFRKTKYGIYEIDESFEEEILKTEAFDGTFLQKIRLYKSINLEQISNESRVSRAYLMAIEANDYDALPAPVFVRGFVVQLARILELNEKKVASSYIELLKQVINS